MELGCEDAFRLTTVREEGRERSLPPPSACILSHAPRGGFSKLEVTQG